MVSPLPFPAGELSSRQDNRSAPSGEGFASVFTGIDYTALGVAEAQPLRLYLFPDRHPGDPIRNGEPHLSYATTDITPNSTMGFSLPRDGGSYLLAALGAEVGGSADLTSLDIETFDPTPAGTPLDRLLGQTAIHTYYFEVTEGGFLRIEGGGGDALRAELIGPQGQTIAVANDVREFAFDKDLALGFHTLILSRAAGGPAETAYSLRVTDRTSGNGGILLTDVSVGRRFSRQVGDNVYGSSAGQIATMVSRRARSVTGHANVGNDGDLAAVLGVSATPGNRRCRIRYLGSTGNVTAALVSGTFRTPELEESDAPVALRMQFNPNTKILTQKRGPRPVTLRRNFRSTIRAFPTSASGAGDAASLRVSTR